MKTVSRVWYITSGESRPWAKGGGGGGDIQLGAIPRTVLLDLALAITIATKRCLDYLKWPGNVSKIVIKKFTNNAKILKQEKRVQTVELDQLECKLHIVILDYDLLKDNGKFSKPMISSKTMTKILYRNFETAFSNAKQWLKERSSGLSSTRFSMLILLTSNHTVFSSLNLK